MILFVYGTLLKGLERSSVLKTSSYGGPAIIDASLYDLGPYPAIRKGLCTTVGETYDIDEEKLRELDQIEAYDESNPSSSLFVRKKLKVTRLADGKATGAFAYFFNGSCEELNVIEHGDYRRHRMESEQPDQWIIAYGSNVSSQRLKRRIGEPIEKEVGYLQGFGIVFNKQASGQDAAYANIQYRGVGYDCPAVAWRLSPEQIEMLDKNEGVPSHYLRISLPFQANALGQIMAQAYVANPDKLVSGKQPPPGYLEHIRTGYREHGFDEKRLCDLASV